LHFIDTGLVWGMGYCYLVDEMIATAKIFMCLGSILTLCMIGLSAIMLYYRREARRRGEDVPDLEFIPWKKRR